MNIYLHYLTVAMITIAGIVFRSHSRKQRHVSEIKASELTRRFQAPFSKDLHDKTMGKDGR